MEIRYIISHGVGEWYQIDQSDTDHLTLYIEPRCSGTLVIGRQRYDIKNGEVSLCISALPDGAYHPRVECKGGVATLSPIVKKGREIYPIESDGQTLRRLVKNGYATEERLCSLEGEVATLKQLCVGHGIFNTERKEI